MPMVRIGNSAPRSTTKSKRSEPTKGSRHATQKVRTLSSISFTRLGVNIRDTNARWIV